MVRSRTGWLSVVAALAVTGGLLLPACSLNKTSTPDPAPSPGAAQPAQPSEAATETVEEVEGVQVVNGKQVRKLASAGATIVDIRSADDFELEHLPEAVSIPMTDFTKKAGFEPDEPVVVYGSKDAKAQTAAAWLVREGYEEVYRLNGGIEAWDGERDGILGKYRLDEPTVIYIYSEDCDVCEKTTPGFDGLAKEFAKKAEFQKLDAFTLLQNLIAAAGRTPTEDEKKAAEAIGLVWIDAVPTFVMVENDPRSYRKIEGADGLQVLRAWLLEK